MSTASVEPVVPVVEYIEEKEETGHSQHEQIYVLGLAHGRRVTHNAMKLNASAVSSRS
jgi:hypothetical protein